MDWCDGTPLVRLARRSFALHAELAQARIREWGYRRMITYSGIMDRSSTSVSRGARPDWVSPNVAIHGQLGSTRTTAQVQPAAFAWPRAIAGMRVRRMSTTLCEADCGDRRASSRETQQ
jgi:hypothetical protein